MRSTTANTHPITRLSLFTLLSIALALGVFLNGDYYLRRVAAQDASEGPWSAPVNLSGSGGVTAPTIVVDASGVVHVIWLEDEAGYNYTRFADGEWLPPIRMKFPFGEYPPVLLAGEEYIYAFWINTGAGNTLMVSRVAIARFGEVAGWEAPKRLSRNVMGISVNYQPGGRIHLAYIHSLEEQNQPEGVVYIQSVDKGIRWSSPHLIYTSKYFRSIKPDEINVQLTVAPQGEQEIVSAAWDNPALKRVFFSQSVDSGVTWQEPQEVDGPSLTLESNSPYKIRLAAEGQRALRLWQGNLQSGANCTQFYQYSNDGGRTWSERAAMFKNVRGCAQRNHLMVIANRGFLLHSVFENEVYLLAFDGAQWSEPQLQSALVSFENPATTDLIALRCHKPWLENGTRLYVVGCDEGGPKDAWFLWRDIDDLQDWFPRPSAWGVPLQVTLNADPIYAAEGAVDRAGRVHILWSQRAPVDEDETAVPEAEKRSIYYAAFDGEKLTNPAEVLSSPDHYVGAFSLAYDSSRDRLSLVWEAGKGGEIYFSWADVARASSISEWAPPVSLPMVEPLGRAPNIIVREDGTIFVAYSIPVNEYRGVYLVKSTDGGVTWSQPIRVFNASGVVQMVDAPKLALSGSQNVYLLWAQSKVLPDPGPINLSYAQSTDDGQTWPAASVAVNEPVEAWWILNSGAAGIQRFWITDKASGSSLFQDLSLNDGGTWSLPANLTGLGESIRAVDINANRAGEISLAQIIEDASGALSLRTQNWFTDTWHVDDTLLLDESALNLIHSLDSQWSPDGRHIIFYVTQRQDTRNDAPPWEIVLRVRNTNAAETPGPGRAATITVVQTTQTAAPQTGASATQKTEPTPLASSEGSAAPQNTLPAASVAPTQLQPGGPQVAETVVMEVPTSASPQTTPLPIPAKANTPPNRNLGLYLAGGISLLVVAVFFALSRYRRMS